MRSIHSLPQELLLLSFTEGMDDELRVSALGEGSYVPCARRMKAFVRVVRNVCRYWRVLVDDPDQTSFWIARPIVRMSKPSSDGDPRALAKDLAVLRARLLTSEGCDLAVIFQVAKQPITSGQEIELRLMLHALDMLVPCQSQIIQFRLDGPQTVVTTYLLEQITSRWKSSQRILEIGLGDGGGRKTISELLDNPGFRTRLDMLQSRGSTQSPPPAFSLAHLENLTRLEIPIASWLDGELTLPHTLHHLRISSVKVDTIPFIYQYLSHNPMRQHLRSLLVGPTVEEECKTTGRTGHPEVTWKAEGPLIFPYLLRLGLYEAAEGQIMAFIGTLICPSLNRLALMWLTEDEDEPHTEPGATIRRPSLPLEEANRNPSLGYVRASPRNTQGSNDVRPQTVPFRLQFCPAFLSLNRVSYHDVLLILISSGIQYLTDLIIGTVGSIRRAHPIHGPILVYTLYQRLTMPSLRELSWSTAPLQFLHFLAHLSAPKLFLIKFSDYTERGPVDESLQEYLLAPFPSVKIIHCLLSDLFIPSNLFRSDLFPNLRQLQVNMHLFPGSSNTSSAFTFSIISLCRPLAPTVEGSVPFPNLRVLDIECTCNRGPAMNNTSYPMIQESEIHTLIDGLLTSRARFGALPLQKIEPVLSFEDMVYEEKIVVRIRASLSPATMNP